MGISRLRELFREIAGEFDERADVRIVTRAYEDALSAIAEAGTARPRSALRPPRSPPFPSLRG